MNVRLGQALHALSANDKRVLDAVIRACSEYDGYMPHGSHDWTAVRRLWVRNLVRVNGDGTCGECREVHDGQLFVVTELGQRALEVQP